ncbi:MAG: YegP family protein [Solirubrobacteraceae bacterium]
MATAAKKSRAARRLPRQASDIRGPDSMEFLVFEDNGGQYYWAIVAGDGATLAQSGSFASCSAAEQAAQQMRAGTASAQYEDRAVVAGLADLVARRDATDADRLPAGGGSLTSETVTRWQAPR